MSYASMQAAWALLVERPGKRGRWLASRAGATLLLATVVPLAPAAEHDRFGTVWRLDGEVKATTSDSVRVLAIGDEVRTGERIRAGAGSEAVVQTLDQGLIAIRPNAEFEMEAYAADKQPTDRLRVRIHSGSLRLVSGWMPSAGTQVLTPAASIGVRGTDHEPYVLPQELADATPYEEGTYEKVNRGTTVLTSANGETVVTAGHVGLARLATGSTAQNADRGLMSFLLPTLLDRMPDFYVPGRFEREIDDYSRHAAGLFDRPLNLASSETRTVDGAVVVCDACAEPGAAADPAAIATRWITQLDTASRELDAAAVLSLFARDAVIDARGRDALGHVIRSRFNRDQFVRSVRTAVSRLEAYEQVRQTLDAQLDPVAAPAPSRMQVRTHVIERGRLKGRDYRTESDEHYVLELRQGRWLAVAATTTLH